jgi:hypothetical protein
VVFSAELLMANAKRGDSLLNDTSPVGVQTELDRLSHLGVRGVAVSIGFPIFYMPYHRSYGEYRGYLEFYKWLAGEVRARKLKLIVESGIVVPDRRMSDLFRGLTFAQYRQGRLETLETIAKELRPDYLSLGSEPDMEAQFTGQPVDDPDTSTQTVNFYLDGLRRAGVRRIAIGAGVGTWQPSYDQFVTRYANATTLDYIDLHVFPVAFDFLERALDIADIAHSAGKKVAMSQAWLYKLSDGEIERGEWADEAMSRDPFRFWAPLDQKFLRTLVKFAHFKDLEFMTPYWSTCFFAYLDYQRAEDWSPRQLWQTQWGEATDNMFKGSFTSTGRAYKQAIGLFPPRRTVPGTVEASRESAPR